jgi:tRNA (guanine6-N2)-methyltransferase
MAALFEAEILAGLKPLALQELGRLLDLNVSVSSHPDRPDSICFRYTGRTEDLLQLRTVVAVYLVLRFEVPRPRGLLGSEHQAKLVAVIRSVVSRSPGEFRSFRISAAGRDSSTFHRIADAVAKETHLSHDPENGDLVMRVRPAVLQDHGWEVLLRLTPRPLSARPWRVADMPGALNATIAAAMIMLSEPKREDRFLNLMCGSGTLLAERAAWGPAARLVGADIDPDALGKAEKNLAAAGCRERISLARLDAGMTPFSPGSFDVVAADLPWGERMREKQPFKRLYRSCLAEAARVCTSGGRLILISQKIRLLEDLLAADQHDWKVEQSLKVFQHGYHPVIYALRKA